MNTGVQCVDAQAAAQSQAILNKVTQDKSLFGMSQDDKIRESFKTNPSLAQMLPGMPVEHRVQMIKILLEGWASGDDKTLARQIWTSVPAAQQTQLTTSDSALKKLIGKL